MAEQNLETHLEGDTKNLDRLARESLPEKQKDTPEALLAMSRQAQKAEISSKLLLMEVASRPEDELKHRAQTLAKLYDTLAADLRADVAKDAKEKGPEFLAAAGKDFQEKFRSGNLGEMLSALANFATTERIVKEPTSTAASREESALSALAGAPRNDRPGNGNDDARNALFALFRQPENAHLADLADRADKAARTVKNTDRSGGGQGGNGGENGGGGAIE